MTPLFDCKVGDRVRVVHGWNPMAPIRTVTAIDEVTGELELDCSLSNLVKVTRETVDIWEVVERV